jgi:hypothetical protein
MTYVLVLITLFVSPETQYVGEYQTLSDCFAEREELVKSIGRPIINYQAVCIIRRQ